ncbi:MAG: DUF1292 domain-containing protein [Ruminococcaceae bacterium]|nr:DUF1292 domain-containing protein [Oscillospiraceae bacterium]
MDENKKNPEELEQEANICYLMDEEGVEHKFEVIDSCEYKGATYYAMIPALESEMDQEFCEYVILKEVVDKDGEASLISIDDNEDEFNAVANIFEDRFDEEIDYDANPEQGKK